MAIPFVEEDIIAKASSNISFMLMADSAIVSGSVHVVTRMLASAFGLIVDPEVSCSSAAQFMSFCASLRAVFSLPYVKLKLQFLPDALKYLTSKVLDMSS